MLMVSAFSLSPRIEEERYQALLRAANEIGTASDCTAASNALTSRLYEVTPFDYLHVITFDKETSDSCWSLLEVNGKRVESSSFALEGSPVQWAQQSGQQMVVLDWERETHFPAYKQFLSGYGIVSTCTLPLIRGPRHLGVLSLGRRYPNAYDQEEVRFLDMVAEHQQRPWEVIEESLEMAEEQGQPMLHALRLARGADGFIERIVHRRPERGDIAGAEAADRCLVQRHFARRQQFDLVHIARRQLRFGIEGADGIQPVAEKI